MATQWKIPAFLKEKTLKTVKKFFDEVAVDEPVHNPLKNFKVNIFNSSLDIIVRQLIVLEQ